MRNKRSCVWIDRFQTKLFVRVLTYWVIYQVTLWNFLFVWRMLEEGPGDPLEQFGRFFGQHYPMLLCCALIVPFFAWDAVRFSHRLVGPLYRFRKTIQSITAGERVRPVQLREGDYLLDMKDDLNDMMTALHQRGALDLDGGKGQQQGAAGACPQVRENA